MFVIVQHPVHFDDEVFHTIEEDDLCVLFVMSGKMSWLDTTELNTIVTKIKDDLLIFVKDLQRSKM